MLILRGASYEYGGAAEERERKANFLERESGEMIVERENGGNSLGTLESSGEGFRTDKTIFNVTAVHDYLSHRRILIGSL